MIVAKFGGTSVQDAEKIDRALDIVEAQLERAPFLVASAMGKTTDRLVETSREAEKGNYRESLKILEEIKTLHYETARSFLRGKNLETLLAKLDQFFQELGSIIRGLSLLKECTARSSDTLLSFGELLSTTVIAARAEERGIPVTWLDSRLLIKTDSQYTNAAPDRTATDEIVRSAIEPEPGRLFIAQGFIASDHRGITTTLGRGGSDFSAAVYGAALGAEEVQIWTDVPGIMTSDPRIVPEAGTVSEISYQEAAELAYFGAKVLHPSTIQPAVERSIPVYVRNTADPEGKHTKIVKKASGLEVRALAMKKNTVLINVYSTRMLNAYGFLSRMFTVFERYKTPVDLIATSEVSVSMTIDSENSLQDIRKELEEFSQVEIEKDRSIISLVGTGLRERNNLLLSVFKSLNGYPVEMISFGSSDVNLSLVVPDSEAEEALRALHREFFSTL